MTPFGCILHKQWQACEEDPTHIIGYWAEDNSEYTISCPHQLRDNIIKLQNNLSSLYIRMKNLNKQTYELQKYFDIIS